VLGDAASGNTTGHAIPPCPPDDVLTYYSYGTPFKKLCGTTTKPGFLDHVNNFKPPSLSNFLRIPWRIGAVSTSRPIVALMGGLGPSNGMPAINQALVDTIDRSGLPIFGFDVLGVGDRDLPSDKDLPTRLLLQVTQDVTWEQGMRLALNCHQQLVGFGLDPSSICCEVFHSNGPSRCETFMSTPEPTGTPKCTLADIPADNSASGPHPFWWPIQDDWENGEYRQYLLGFTRILGQPISTTADPSIHGSSGLYIQLTKTIDGQEKCVDALLTNRHVVVPDKTPAFNYLQQHPKMHADSDLIKVFQPSSLQFRAIQQGLDTILQHFTTRNERLSWKETAELLNDNGKATYNRIQQKVIRPKRVTEHCQK
jgi:hypothetical protein